jgi:hypothetical protein
VTDKRTLDNRLVGNLRPTRLACNSSCSRCGHEHGVQDSRLLVSICIPDTSIDCYPYRPAARAMLPGWTASASSGENMCIPKSWM